MQPKPAPFPEPEPVLISSPAPAPQLSRPAAAIELDKLDLAFDPQRSTFEDPTPSVLDGQWHDAATKLDLAKAYQEMGDVEGAREILQEVLHEGDEQQKAEAQTLLSRLA
jgi:pilus assembly protein FimV